MARKTEITVHTPCQMYFDDLYVCSDGLIMASKYELWGFVDKNGHEVIPLIYDSIDRSYDNDIIYVELNGLHGIIDRSGNTVIPCVYDESVMPSYSGFWGIRDGKYHLLNEDGEALTDLNFDDIWTGHDKLNAVRIGERWGIFSEETCEMLVEPHYQEAYPLSKDIILVRLNDRLGVIDATGKEILPPFYTEIRIEPDRIVCVKRDGKWGIIEIKQVE